ncbi:unnamed protein product [Auanema sp. JU1783]|nr:unnamed protein product [Auanema sp. JU1783]
MDKNKHDFRNNYQNVTIEIDSDDENESDELLHIPGLSIPIKFGVKYNLSHVEFEVSDIYELCDLTVESMEILSGHLNMKAYGSMKNWEYVACSYGMSSDSIMMMQRDYNPFELLCKKFPRKNLKEFIGLLQTMNRIDTLYSLKKIFDASLLCKTDKFGRFYNTK